MTEILPQDWRSAFWIGGRIHAFRLLLQVSALPLPGNPYAIHRMITYLERH